MSQGRRRRSDPQGATRSGAEARLEQAVFQQETAIRTNGKRIETLLGTIRRDPSAFTLAGFLRVLLADHQIQQARDAELQARKHVEFDDQAPALVEMRAALTEYLQKLTAPRSGSGKPPMLAGSLRDKFPPAFLQTQVKLYRKEVREANALRGRSTSKPRVSEDWAELAAAIVRRWAHEQSQHVWAATVWSRAVPILIGRCRVAGVDEDFVREWTARDGEFMESDPRAGELYRLAAAGEQVKLLDTLHSTLTGELKSRLDTLFDGVNGRGPRRTNDRPLSTSASGAEQESSKNQRQDGPVGGNQVWYQGKSVPLEGRDYQVIDHFWKREFDSFDALKTTVNEEVTDGTIHTWVHRANNALAGLSLPWKLKAGGRTRHVRKVDR